MSEEVDRLARVIWDYHHVNHRLEKADCILALGSNDVRVAEYAAKLYFDGYAPFLTFSGGLGRLTAGRFDKPEAEVFAEIALKLGVPPEKIVIENKSTNTGENIEFTKKILSEKDLDFQSFIVVQKPYMERRTRATFLKRWSEKKFIVASPPISYEDYPNIELPKELIINIMVGDLQRIKVYPEKGYQVPQVIPAEVWQAYEKLVELGFTQHLIDE